MRNLKKVLALVLAMAMSLSLAVSAGAAFNDQDKIVNTEAVDMCSALGIINGYTDGSFKPEGNVTRAEAAKMICIALNGGKEPVLSASATPVFADIAGHWAAKYIEYCNSLGIVAGKSATQFDPNGNVTGVELAKMLLIAIGYDAAAEKFVGGNWDTNVNVIASQKDLYEELETIDPAAPATRDVAAQMVWNALNIFMVDYDYKLSTDANGNLVSELKVEDIKGQTLLTDKFETKKTELTTGKLIQAEYLDKDEEYKYTIENTKEGAITVFTTADNYVELLGQDVTFVAKAADKVYGAFSNSVVVASDLVGNYEKCTKDDDCMKIDGVEYDVDKKAAMVGAFAADHKATLGEAQTAPYFTANAIDYDDDGDIDTVLVMAVNFANVNYVGKDYVNTDSTVSALKKLKAEDYSIYEGVAKEDKVLVSADLSLVTLGNVTEVEKQTGKVESYTGDNVTIGGTVYDYTTLAEKKADALAVVTANMNSDVEFYAYNGYLLKVDASTSVNINEFAVITKIAGEAGMTGPQAKLLFTDGTEQVVDLAKDYAKDAGMVAGDLVKFEIKDGEYELTAFNAEKDMKDFDAVASKENKFEGAESTAKADAKIAYKDGKAKFAADAVIFVKDLELDAQGNVVDTDYVVMTGADVAKITGAADIVTAGAEKDANRALTTTFAYIATAGASDSDAVYGYVVSDVTYSQNADKENFETVTVWDGAKEVVLTTAANKTFGEIAEGSLISYTVDADGAVTTCKPVAAGDAVALTVIDGDFVTIAGKSYEIDEDTVILYVDATETAGAEGGAISVATETEKEGVYYANVKFEADKDGKVLKLLVVDVDNDWDGKLD